jgi:hypothetical protein
MEAIGYMLIYFIKGQLPWQGLGGKQKSDKYNAIRDKKISTPIEVLCKGLPAEFAEYLKIARGLKFEETPPYAHLKDLFAKLMVSQKLTVDDEFDWFLTKE